MTKFSLLCELSNKKVQPCDSHSIKYQEYELIVSGLSTKVYVPLRECDNFENTLESHSDISTDSLRLILRKHRAILEISK